MWGFIFQAPCSNKELWDQTIFKYFKYLIACTCNRTGHFLLYLVHSPLLVHFLADVSEPASADSEHQARSVAGGKDQKCPTEQRSGKAVVTKIVFIFKFELFSVLTSS